MRVLSSENGNKAEIYDPQSQSIVVMYYRRPTPSEVVEYQSGIFTREGMEVKLNADVRLKAGAALLTGIENGCFCDADGKQISSTEGDDNYNPEWKKIITEGAPDLVMALAQNVFEGIVVKLGGGDTLNFSGRK